MKWPKDRMMTAETAQKLIDALNAVYAEMQAPSPGYPPLNTATLKEPYLPNEETAQLVDKLVKRVEMLEKTVYVPKPLGTGQNVGFSTDWLSK